MHAEQNQCCQVVRAAMEHVAAIKRKGRAAGPQDSEFQRLYNPVQYRAQLRREEREPLARPRSAPRPKSSNRLADEVEGLLPGTQRSLDMSQRSRVTFKQENHQGRSQSAPRARSAPRQPPIHEVPIILSLLPSLSLCSIHHLTIVPSSIPVLPPSLPFLLFESDTHANVSMCA